MRRKTCIPTLFVPLWTVVVSVRCSHLNQACLMSIHTEPDLGETVLSVLCFIHNSLSRFLMINYTLIPNVGSKLYVRVLKGPVPNFTHHFPLSVF